MRTIHPVSKLMFFLFLTIIFFFPGNPAKAELTNKERNILAKEAKAIDLAKSLITDNSWNKFPDYKTRSFWEKLPENIRTEYIAKAEGYLTYAWPVVKATDYLEIIRSGDRRQSAYSACSSALISLVMVSSLKGKVALPIR